ncbi:MAG: InlB B-repeat-containing protein, partial [Planctomycetota bacterium]
GSDLDFTADPNTGYEVDKWSVDGSDVQTGGDSFTLSDIQADHSVDVTFKLLEFNIEGIAGPNGAISPVGDTTVTYGSDLEFTATPDGEYLVRIWSVDGEQVQIGGTEFTLMNIQADHTVDVSFSLLYYLVSSSSTGGGSIDPDATLTAEPGDSLSYSAEPDDEYRIIHWSVDGEVVQWEGSGFTLSDIQDDHSVTVLFGQVDYAITATAGPGGSVSPKNVGVTSGGNYTFTATPDAGYEVDTWFMDSGVAQTGGATYEVRGPIYEDHAIHVTFKKKLCESLGTYEFEAEDEFEDGIITNNPPEPAEPLVIVKPVGLGDNPDNKVMEMSNGARAKGTFAKTSADEIQICFKYLFTDPNVALAVSISDSPALLAPDDPLRAQHYIKVGLLAPPPADQAGSPGSDRFGVFQKMVWTDDLDFADGLYVELELTEPNANVQALADAAVYIDNWSASLDCNGVCLDINGDNAVSSADLLKVVGAYGSAATGSTACLEGAFTADGYVDSYDVVSWDWAMNSDQRLLGYCGLPLTGESGGVSLMSAGAPVALAANAPSDLSDILIAGRTAELKDSLCVFDSAGRAGGSSASSRGNIRLAQGPDGGIYLLNSETGLVRLDGTGEVVVPSGKLDIAGEPRYNSSATVYVGIQNGGPDSFGRPVLDVALDAEYVYVVPVVVSPD